MKQQLQVQRTQLVLRLDIENQDEIKEQWHMDKRFEPTMEAETSEELYAGWKKAIEATKAFK